MTRPSKREVERAIEELEDEGAEATVSLTDLLLDDRGDK